MFGFNIFEILVILIVAIIFLGPDKLPQLIIDVVKFFKMIKKSIGDAKETFDKELQISEIKKEALEYKAQFENKINDITEDIKLQDINTMFKEYQEDLQETVKPSNLSKKPRKKTSQNQVKKMASTEEDSSIKKTQIQKNSPNPKKITQNTIQPNIGKKTSFKANKKRES